MVTCVRSFTRFKGKGGSIQRAISEFNKRRAAEGHRVIKVISCREVGDSVYAIVANIDLDYELGGS